MNKNAVMWFVILLLASLLLVGSVVYISGRVCRFELWRRLFGEGRAPFLYAALLVLCVLVALRLCLGTVNAIVCFLHALSFWLLCDGGAWVVHKLSGRVPGPYRAGMVALVLTLLWLSYGWYNAHHVRRTVYTLEGEVSEPFRVVGFSDAHVGAVFNGDAFYAYVERMNAEAPDAVVIVGDFVDDDSSLRDMESAVAALGKLQTKYGVYYVFGNHDSGYLNSRRGYDREKLVECLRANGVCVLEDEIVRLRGNVCLCGRQDAHSERMSAYELTEGLSEEDYVILLDHQPTDYGAEMEAGADLVLSGHTHGGQLIPIRRLIRILGNNGRNYGHEKRGNTDFIVSSGIGDWAMDFKTGCISEYFVVDIAAKPE